jgi:hypothetical protein
MFSNVDSNSDGGITQAEMKSFGSQMGLDEAKIEEQFGKFDTDGNGSIDAKEHEAIFEQIATKLRGAFGQGGPQTGSTDAAEETNDVLMAMMDKIREHSEQQPSGGNSIQPIQQFLSQLQPQNNSYNQNGSNNSSSMPSFFSGAA